MPVRLTLSPLRRIARWTQNACTWLLISIAACHAQSTFSATTPVDWVNPYIGSGEGPIGYGGAMPFVTTPFA